MWIVVYMHQGLTSWAMMGQAIEEGKGFLRIRLDADGALTVHPILTEELVTDFEISPEHGDHLQRSHHQDPGPGRAAAQRRGSSRSRSGSCRPDVLAPAGPFTG